MEKRDEPGTGAALGAATSLQAAMGRRMPAGTQHPCQARAVSNQRREDRSQAAPRPLDHLPPGTRPQDVGAGTTADTIPPRRDVDTRPRHEEDTRGSGPVAERDHFHGPDQNPK